MTRVVLFATSAVAWVVLTYLTAFVTKLSSWVVNNDAVWLQMNADGLKQEHMLCETIHAVKGFPFTIAVGVFGLVLLGFLFRTLFRSGPPQSAL